MSINYKIILDYIKDISVEVPDADVLIVTRENITNYLTDIKISSKVMKNNTMEIDTKLIYYDKNKTKKKSHFEITYSTVLQVQDKSPNKEVPKLYTKMILASLYYITYFSSKKLTCFFLSFTIYVRCHCINKIIGISEYFFCLKGFCFMFFWISFIFNYNFSFFCI